ncbi:hypothetical protein KAR91_25490 [Candidatus Pacearchaeota archaeon]|nr:hypothetical protein [Candidatus Pacearchaeota archaeon]
MKILQKIKKRLGIKTQEIPSEPIQKPWAYKLTVGQVALIYEADDLGVFGMDKEKKFEQFNIEFNDLFNNAFHKKQFNSDLVIQKMQLKMQKLRAMYDALSVCEAPNCREEFKLMFGHDFNLPDDLKLITDKYAFYGDKLPLLIPRNNEAKESMTFIDVVLLTEISRGLQIDRNILLYDFHRMYKTELKKWTNG